MYIVVEQVVRPPQYFPSKASILQIMFVIAKETRYPPEPVVVPHLFRRFAKRYAYQYFSARDSFETMKSHVFGSLIFRFFKIALASTF